MIRDITIRATTKNRHKARATSQCQITSGFKLLQRSKRKKSSITAALWESRKSHNSRHMEMRVTRTTKATVSQARIIINRTITIVNSNLVITNRKRRMGKLKVATMHQAATNQKKFPIPILVAIKSRNRKKIGRHKLQEIWLQKLWHKT